MRGYAEGMAQRGRSSAEWHGRTFAAAVVVFATTAVVFFPATFGEWLEWDDTANFVHNERYRGLSFDHLRWMFTTFHLGHYQPLSWITLAIDYRLWGMAPRGYHLTNQLLHAVSAVLVFCLTRRVTRIVRGVPGESGWWGSEFVAAAIALVWSLHPMRVESVAWITERRDVLSSCLWLAAIYFYLCGHASQRYDDSTSFPSDEATKGSKRGMIVAAWIALVLSLLSRAIGITFPVILLILDWGLLRRIGGARGWISHSARGVWLEKLVFAAPAFAAALIAPLAQKSAAAVMTLHEHSVSARVAQACFGVVCYVWKTFVPIQLSPFHELNLPLNVYDVRYAAPIALVAIGALALLIFRRRAWPVIVASGIFVVVVSPVLGFVQSGRQEVAYRYSYLPTIALIMLVGLWIERTLARRSGSARLAAAIGAVVLIAVFAAQTLRQIGVWRSTQALWTEAARIEPNSTTNQMNFGYYVLLNEGRVADAAKCFERAIALRPDNELAHENLWLALDRLGRADDLEKALTAALEIPGVAASARVARGNLSWRYGDIQTAISEYEAALHLRPTYAEAAIALSKILVGAGRAADAAPHIRMLQADHADDPRVVDLVNKLKSTEAR